MNKIKNIILSALIGIGAAHANTNQDPNNLFLVEVDNVFNQSLAGKNIGMPNIGDRTMSAEEILMYQILNCRWESGRWLRYTGNPNGKGTIKVGHPFLQADGNRLFFISDIPGGAGGFDVYYSEKRNGKWSDPTNVGLKVNSSADELFPFVTAAGILQVYRNSQQLNFDLAEVLGSSGQYSAAAKPATVPASQPVAAAPVTQPVQENKPAPVSQPAPTQPAPATPTASISTAAQSGVQYRIQLGSFSNPNWTVLNQLSDLGNFQTIKTPAGLTSVHLGAFSSLAEAQELAKKVKLRAGFENAYVVAVENGKVVSIHR